MQILGKQEKETLSFAAGCELEQKFLFYCPAEHALPRSDTNAQMLDEMDVKILKLLQQDCTPAVAVIGKQIGLSTTPCWRRIQKLEAAGIIQRRVAVLDPTRVNSSVTVFVAIKTDEHSLAWLERFHATVVDFSEVVEFYRMSGDVDYLLRVVVPDIAAYDSFYKKMISRIEISKVSSAFAMEQIKYTTALPLDFALRGDQATSEAAAAATSRSASHRRRRSRRVTE